jgi:SAM-dependent methyltransferase
VAEGWEWDPSLYEGSAPFYAVGRVPYPAEVAAVLRRELGLDGTGRLLDVGCGPGPFALLLAGLFTEAVGVDADVGMVEEAARQGRAVSADNVRWICMRAESLPAGLGTFRLASLAQSFHWMDRPRVAAILLGMLDPGGAVVHVGAWTHRGMGPGDDLPGPTPPWDRIDELVVSYLGPVRRAGRGILPAGTASDEDEVFPAAGFVGPTRITVGWGEAFVRSEDEIVASVFSLSSATPHLFGARMGAFEQDLRSLLRSASATGEYWERAADVGLTIWTKPLTQPSPPIRP